MARPQPLAALAAGLRVARSSWSGRTTPANTAKAIEPLCLQWAEENGVTCTVKKFNGGADLNDALVAGNAPETFRICSRRQPTGSASLVQNGILSPIDLASNQENFSEVAVQAVVNGGATYGVPWAVENVALLTNKELAPECPATMDEAVGNAKELIDAGTTPRAGHRDADRRRRRRLPLVPAIQRRRRLRVRPERRRLVRQGRHGRRQGRQHRGRQRLAQLVDRRRSFRAR